LVLETEDPQELLGLFAALRTHAVQERALWRAGRLTARQYAWPQVPQRVLLPRLALHDHPTLLETAAQQSLQVARRIEGQPATNCVLMDAQQLGHILAGLGVARRCRRGLGCPLCSHRTAT